jgi:hypothetical protein
LIASLSGSRRRQRGADASRKWIAAARVIVVRTISYLDNVEVDIVVTGRSRERQFSL